MNLLASPLFHIGGTGYALTAKGQGAHTVLMAEVDPIAMVRAIERHRVTHAFFVPAVVTLLLDAAAEADLSSLEVIAYGGAPDDRGPAAARDGYPELRVHGRPRHGGDGGQRHRAGSRGPRPWRPPFRPAALGGPAAAVARGGGARPGHRLGVRAGEVGEIWVRSGQNTPGYWHRPEESAATLAPDGWPRTGDAAHTDADGYLFLHDRIKDMIISGGRTSTPRRWRTPWRAPSVVDVAVIGIPASAGVRR